MDIGFTGTQEGMTIAQKKALRIMLEILSDTESFHHGDCIGADEQAHEIAADYFLDINILPPTNPSKRAFCKWKPEKIWPEKEYLERNRNIVRLCSVLIAAPRTEVEKMRSGTWATVRYAREAKKPVIILRPDGLVDLQYEWN